MEYRQVNMQNVTKTPQQPAPSPKDKKLLDQVRDAIRTKHYSLRTEKTYVDWIRRFILFHKKRHPREMGVAEVQEFIVHLAADGNVSASTQNQALSAVTFLYRHVLHTELEFPSDTVRPGRSKPLPVVLTPQEARAVITNPSPPHLPPLLRHPPAPERLRHPHRPGTPRTQRRQNHHDLHPRPPARRSRCQIPHPEASPSMPVWKALKYGKSRSQPPDKRDPRQDR
jgi:hypothetical protein